MNCMRKYRKFFFYCMWLSFWWAGDICAHISQGKGFFLNYRMRGALWEKGSSVASTKSPTSNLAVPVLLQKLKLEKFIPSASRKINVQCHCQAVICGTTTGIGTSTIIGPQSVSLWDTFREHFTTALPKSLRYISVFVTWLRNYRVLHKFS